MKTNFQNIFVAGIVATLAMSMFLFVGTWFGLPKMNPPQMLAEMLEFPILVGWFIHFIIGLSFAAMYVLFFLKWLTRFSSRVVKGFVFGVAVFLFAQIALGVMGSLLGSMPESEGRVVLLMLASVLGHVVYGVILVLLIKEPV